MQLNTIGSLTFRPVTDVYYYHSSSLAPFTDTSRAALIGNKNVQDVL